MIILVILFTAGVTYSIFNEPAPVDKTSEQIYKEAREGKR